VSNRWICGNQGRESLIQRHCALAESFNGVLKVERVHRTVYATRRKAREDITRYIELRYNRKRLYSALGYRTPQEAMDEYLEMKATA
jgi:putative transposase